MPFPIDVTRCLAFAPADTPLEVSCIPSDALRARLALDGLFEHDQITCRPDSSGRVLVRTADGLRITVDRRYAVVIEVGPTSGGATRNAAVRGVRRGERSFTN